MVWIGFRCAFTATLEHFFWPIKAIRKAGRCVTAAGRRTELRVLISSVLGSQIRNPEYCHPPRACRREGKRSGRDQGLESSAFFPRSAFHPPRQIRNPKSK